MKNFRKWNNLKEKIEQNFKHKLFHEKEIWWCSLGVNIGDEQDGKNENFERPVLILKKFNKNILWGIPLTSKNKNGKYYYNFKYKKKNFAVILSQLRLISSKRLLRRMRRIGRKDFYNVKQLIRTL